MASKWDDFIQEGKYKGVRFDFVSAREQYSNALDVQTFPNRNGATIVPKARNPVRLEVMAVFIEDDYPDQMYELQRKLNKAEPGELVHPIYGPIQASAESYTVTHDAEDADSGTIQIQFIEHTTDPKFTWNALPSRAAKANETRGDAEQVNIDVGNYVQNILDQQTELYSNAVALSSVIYFQAVAIGDQCMEAAALASAAADLLEEDGEQLSFLELQAAANGVLAAANAAVAVLADYETQESYDLSRSLLLMAAATGELATLIANSKPPLTIVYVQADIPLLSWVHAFYGDSERTGEVLSLNSIEDPLLLKAGTQLRVYAV